MKKSPIALDIRRMATGNTDALSQFYYATAEAAYALALSMLRSSDAASNAMQEAYLNAYETASDYCPKESALTWFLSLVYRQCRLQEGITAEDIPSDFTPVAALSLLAHLTPREIAKITGLPRKEIPSFKHLSNDAPLVAFCDSIPERIPDLCQTVVISALLSSGKPPIPQPENIPGPTPKHAPNFQWKWLAYGLPVLALLLLVVFFTNYEAPEIPVATTIYLDGGSGICLELDENDKVLNIKASNDLTQPLFEELNLRNTPVDAAMGQIVDAMVNDGRLKIYPDALLLSVSPSPGGQEETQRALEKYQFYLLSALEQQQLPTVLFSQPLPTEDRVLELAEKYQISPGMAGFIHCYLHEPASYADAEEALKFLSDKSPFYFYWLMAFGYPEEPPQISIIQTGKMSQYDSPEELLSASLYLLTDAKARKPGSRVTLTDIYVDADNVYNLYLVLSGKTYHLRISALTGYFLSCTHNWESVPLDFNSKYVGLDTFIEKEKAISLALNAAGYNADSVAFITAEIDSEDIWNGFLESTIPAGPALDISPSYDIPPYYIEVIPVFRKYRVTFYSEDMYTYYCVDVDVARNMVLSFETTESPAPPGGVSPRRAVTQALAKTRYTEDDIVSVTYEVSTAASNPYYVIHLQFSDGTRNYFVDLLTGNIIMMPNSYLSKDEAVQAVADHFGLTPEAVYSSQELSITHDAYFYRVNFTDGTTAYRAAITLSEGKVMQAETRPVITLERAYSLAAEAVGIRPEDATNKDYKITDNEYIIQLFYGKICYVSRVCRNTGVILNTVTRNDGDSAVVPSPPSGTRTKEEALQIALEDLFATVDTVNQVTTYNTGDYHYVSFLDSSGKKYIYFIARSMSVKNPIVNKIS